MTKQSSDWLDDILETLKQQLLYEGTRLTHSEEHAKRNANLYISEAKKAILSKTKEQALEMLPEKMYDVGQIVYVEDTGGKRAEWLKEQEEYQKLNGTGDDFMDGFNQAIDQMKANIKKGTK